MKLFNFWLNLIFFVKYSKTQFALDNPENVLILIASFKVRLNTYFLTSTWSFVSDRVLQIFSKLILIEWYFEIPIILKDRGLDCLLLRHLNEMPFFCYRSFFQHRYRVFLGSTKCWKRSSVIWRQVLHHTYFAIFKVCCKVSSKYLIYIQIFDKV